jgi:DNA-binding MarR family transcriptional regulator
MSAAPLNGPDEIIHQSVRLKIMAALNALPENSATEFSQLRAITGATDGNLGAHLTTLETAGYIAIAKDFIGKKPRTRVSITREGRRAFTNHVAYLRDILDSATMLPGGNTS